ncbi:hypothetical protein BC829DRAFT_434380 [Chytridium lagenaria]|nr:hypothetical protein BC829DRAFT_434380 [Chytridium lagenaria]
MVQIIDKIVAFYRRAREGHQKRQQSKQTQYLNSTKLKASNDVRVSVEKATPVVLVKDDGKTAAESELSFATAKPFGAIGRRSTPTGKVIAIHGWEPRLPDQLELQAGDKITIAKIFGDGWASGRNETKHTTGIFPINCVEALDATASLKSFDTAEDIPEAGEERSAWKQDPNSTSTQKWA